MELRFAGEGSDLGALIEREMATAQELDRLREVTRFRSDRLREVMRFRSDRLPGAWNGMGLSQGWDGTEPDWANGA